MGKEGIRSADNAFFRQLLFIGVLLVIGWLIVYRLKFFVGAFLGAATLYVVLRRVMFYLTERWHWRSWLAASVLVLAMTVLLSGLGFFTFRLIAPEVSTVDTVQVKKMFNLLLERVNDLLGFRIVPEKVLQDSGGVVTRVASSLFDTTYSFTVNVLLMLVVLFFMLQRGRKMEQQVRLYLPFRGTSLTRITQAVKGIIFSNAVGIPLVMLCQGVASVAVYWLLGVPDFVFWAFLTAVCGLIPMVGTAVVTVPMGIYLWVEVVPWQGIVMWLCAFLVIANVDSLCRIVLMRQITNTHPLIVVFGVILGIPLFGFWGIIFGPLLLSGFLLLIQIYYWEYGLIRPDTPSLEQKEQENNSSIS